MFDSLRPPWTVVHGILQARILDWIDFPSPGDLPNLGIESRSPALQADSLLAEPPGKPCNSNNAYKFLFYHLHFTDEEMGSWEEKEITQTTIK